MSVLRSIFLWLGASSLALAATGQTFPSKPLKVVVPFAASGPADVVARDVSQRLSEVLGQPVIIDNQGGGMGVNAIGTVARADADGHTLLFAASGNLAIQPLLSKSSGADLSKLTPVSLVSNSPHVLVVSARLPVKSLKDFLDHARANPGKLSYGSAGAGGVSHLGMALLASMSKLDMVHIPYKGTSAALNDLMSGQVDAMLSSMPSMQPAIDKGYVLAIGVTGASSSAATKALPQISTVVPGFDYTTWYAILAPAATPKPVIAKLNDALKKVLADPALQAKLEPHGLELQSSTPQEVALWTKRDTEKWAKVIRDAKITVQ